MKLSEAECREAAERLEAELQRAMSYGLGIEEAMEVVRRVVEPIRQSEAPGMLDPRAQQEEGDDL